MDELATNEELSKPNGMDGSGATSVKEEGSTGHSKLTQRAQLDAMEALEKVDVALEVDRAADEAGKALLDADQTGDRGAAKEARKRERSIRKQAKQAHREATKTARQAYDAIRFSEPGNMGLMRVVQVLFALHIGVTLLLLLLTSRDDYTYGVATAMSWILVILEGMAFWMFNHRFKAARPLVMGLAVATLTVDAITNMVDHTFSFALFVKDGLFYLLLLAYFAFSSRVRHTLVNDFSTYSPQVREADFEIPRKGWPFVRNLVIYFILFSILGHWMEMAMCQLIRLGLVQGEYDPSNTMLWRDWLYPFPMEGAAVVIIALVLYPLFVWLKKNCRNKVLPYVLSFLANALTCSIIEFSMGLIVNADYQLWDYRTNFGNIMGQVCLQNALAFGVACSVITWFVYPMLEQWIARIPRDYMNMAFVATLMFGGIIWSLYIVNPPTIEPGVDRTYSHALPGGAEASFNVTTSEEQTQGDNSPQLEITFNSAESEADTLAVLEDRAAYLREVIANDKDLTDEQRASAQEQVDAIEQSIAKLREVMGKSAS